MRFIKKKTQSVKKIHHFDLVPQYFISAQYKSDHATPSRTSPSFLCPI